LAGVEPQAIVGRNIKAAREAAGLTQEQLGERAGMLTHEISRYERGVRDLRLTTAVRIARGLGIPAADLLRDL
jgi:XRE family transcriptional regulator, fatty acid utilization regulator